ncbi:MAG: hypothetical protein ACRCX2_32415 [Paraclostridium sp.]
MELSNRKALLARAKYLMTKYSYDALTSLKIAEQEHEEQKKKENEGEVL